MYSSKLLGLASLFLGLSLISSWGAAPATPQGTITARIFENIGGATDIASLTNNAAFPDSPTEVRYEPYFELWAEGAIDTPPAADVKNNYGAQMTGYFYPETTGDYTFYISADDNASLYLSTDDNPANKKLIAIEPQWNNPRDYQTPGGNATGRNLDTPENNSATYTGSEWATPNKIALQAGKAYYIEALMKEGGGGDNLSVSIDGSMPIPGSMLSPFGVSSAARIVSQPQEASVYAGAIANFTVGLDLPPGITLTSIEWQKNGVAIPNSNTNTLSLATTAADNAAKIKAIVTTSSGTLTSSEATLNVATLGNEFTPGVIKFEAFRDLTGTTIAELTDSDKYIANQPDDVRLLNAVDTPNGYGDNYGARVSGFITPPEAGDYTFFLRSDDASQLWLSMDENPANAQLIAEETGCCQAFLEPDPDQGAAWHDNGNGMGQTTLTPITLAAGKRYAFYALVKEGGGGDYLQVAVRKAGNTTPAASLTPLGGTWIGANAKPSIGDPQITTQPQSIPQLLQGRNATLTVAGSVLPAGYGFPVSIQWQKNGTDIPGATSGTLNITNATSADSGTYRAVVTAPSGKSITSAEATVTYAADVAGPQVSSVSVSGLQSILVGFDEPLDRATAENIANYQVSDGVTVSQAVLGGSGSSVLLTTSALTPDKQYTLTVNNIKDPFNNTVTANAQTTFVSKVISYADIILQDGPVAFYRFEETSGSVAKNSGSTGGDAVYTVGDELEAGAGGTPGEAKGDPGPRPPEFLGFASDNRAATLGGADTQEWIDTRNKFLDHKPAFTIEYWVKPTNRVGAATAWSRVGIVGQNDAIEYGFINGTTIQIWTAGGGSLDTSYPYPDNEWHHIATIADGRSIKNYFDGKLVGTGGSTTGDYGTSTYNVHIGGGGVFDATANWFQGQFDEVAIFDKAIPAERIAAHYQAGREGFVPPSQGTGAQFTTVSRTGAQLTLAWTGSATLEEAPSVTGPWTPVPNATSPATVTPGGTKFYRLR